MIETANPPILASVHLLPSSECPDCQSTVTVHDARRTNNTAGDATLGSTEPGWNNTGNRGLVFTLEGPLPVYIHKGECKNCKMIVYYDFYKPSFGDAERRKCVHRIYPPMVNHKRYFLTSNSTGFAEDLLQSMWAQLARGRGVTFDILCDQYNSLYVESAVKK